MKRKWILLILFFAVPLNIFAQQKEELPPLMDGTPPKSFQILTPVGAGKKSIPEAREQLQREAKKVDADAVIEVRCEPGGMGRNGLTFYHKDAYCRGKAIRFGTAYPSAPLL